MKLIVGLGNPGIKYKETRHNVGYMFVDKVVEEYGLKFVLNKQLKSEITNTIINNEKIIFIKPQTYMNLSGDAVLSVINYYKIELNNVLVIYDDLDLPTGKLRIRQSGSSGGQKGIQNIIDRLNTNNIKRVRIGINNNSKIDAVNYVLGKFTTDELISINLTLDKSVAMINSFVRDSFADFMNKFNRSLEDE